MLKHKPLSFISSPCLDTESAAHVIVALNDVEIVALGTTEQDTAQEETLFHLRQGQLLILASDKSSNLNEASRVKVNVHVVRRGHLLGYEAQVFGDTFRSVDEVNCPRFFLYFQKFVLTLQTNNKNNYMIMKKQFLLFVLMMLPLVASADPVEINGIYYSLNTEKNIAW